QAWIDAPLHTGKADRRNSRHLRRRLAAFEKDRIESQAWDESEFAPAELGEYVGRDVTDVGSEIVCVDIVTRRSPEDEYVPLPRRDIERADASGARTEPRQVHPDRKGRETGHPSAIRGAQAVAVDVLVALGGHRAELG